VYILFIGMTYFWGILLMSACHFEIRILLEYTTEVWMPLRGMYALYMPERGTTASRSLLGTPRALLRVS